MNAIKQYREKAGLSQSALAERCGWINSKTGKGLQSRVAQYEAGTRRPPLSVCRQIVETLCEAGARCTLDKVFPPEDQAA